MTPALKLRDYQTDAIDAVQAAWAAGTKRPAVVLPTGMGKTVIFAELIRIVHTRGGRPLVLVHRDELVRQTVAKVHTIAPGMTVGIIKAERQDTDQDVIVASVQTLGRRTRLAQVPAGNFTAVIVDECHHAAADSYTRIMEYFGCFDTDLPVRAVGFTATMERGDSRALGDVWQEVVSTKDIMYGIEHGYLVDPLGRKVTVDGLDLGEVARSRGDWQDNDLGEALLASGAGDITAQAYLDEAQLPDGTLRKGILFAPTVKAAEGFAAAFTDAGIPTEVIVGETTVEDRQAIYRRVSAGTTRVIASCMVLTEGFDMPEMSCAVIARPTSRAGLYIQMVGRVLRPFPGKDDALVMDVVGVSQRHALACLADLMPGDHIVVNDGESLAEAVERTKRLRAGMAGMEIDGERSIEDVDLFHRSTSAWLKTNGGIWFLPTKLGYIFLAPDTRPTADVDSWLIGKTADQYRKAAAKSKRYALDSDDDVRGDSWGWLRGAQGIEYAMAFAEQYAEALDGSVSSRKSSWRAKRNMPSPAQTGLAERLGIETFGMNKSQVSDAISTFYASRCLDTQRRP